MLTDNDRQRIIKDINKKSAEIALYVFNNILKQVKSELLQTNINLCYGLNNKV